MQDQIGNSESQLERLNKQYTEERSRYIEELRSMQSKVTELSIQVL